MMVRPKKERGRAASIGLFACLLLSGTLGEAGGQNPSAEEIIDQTVARAITQQESDAATRFESTFVSVLDSLDGDGNVEKTERELYRRYPVEGVLVDELLEKNGSVLSEKEARKEQEKREEYIREARRRMGRGDEPETGDERQVRFDSDFVDRYDWAILGEETLRDHKAWVLSLKPREGKLPVRRRMDHALNKSTGKIWVAQDDYGLVRVEFQMLESVRFWGGLLGTLRDTVGRLEFDRIEPGVWLPVELDIRFDLRILVKNIRQRVRRQWEGYERYVAEE